MGDRPSLATGAPDGTWSESVPRRPLTAGRRLPRPFTMHWGSGFVTEEASFSGEYHEPCIQLLEFTEGEARGSVSVRFCYYTPDGRFQRSPLMMSADEVEGLNEALRQAPKLRALLRKMVE